MEQRRINGTLSLSFSQLNGKSMGTNYEMLILENLKKFFGELPEEAGESLGAIRKGDQFSLRAFGETCRIEPSGVPLSGKPADDPRGLLISLYASHASAEPLQIEPLKSYKDFPDSMPYHVAFKANTETILVPYVKRIYERQARIISAYNGSQDKPDVGADFSLTICPLPKIALCYIFYLPDEEFPASSTCLFSANALSFMPIGGLADVAEYTSRGIIEISMS
jgi:hypothetical protein